MNTFPSGFMADFHILTGITEEEFAQYASETDFNDVEQGEPLLAQALQEQATRHEISSPQVFLGARSLAGTSIAKIKKMKGEDLLDQLAELIEQFGGEKSEIMGCLPALFAHSNTLSQLAQDGIEIVRPNVNAPSASLEPVFK